MNFHRIYFQSQFCLRYFCLILMKKAMRTWWKQISINTIFLHNRYCLPAYLLINIFLLPTVITVWAKFWEILSRFCFCFLPPGSFFLRNLRYVALLQCYFDFHSLLSFIIVHFSSKALFMAMSFTNRWTNMVLCWLICCCSRFWFSITAA